MSSAEQSPGVSAQPRTPPQVEWNPTGDVWVSADVLEERSGGDIVIRLHGNAQVLVVKRRHTREVPNA